MKYWPLQLGKLYGINRMFGAQTFKALGLKSFYNSKSNERKANNRQRCKINLFVTPRYVNGC